MDQNPGHVGPFDVGARGAGTGDGPLAGSVLPVLDDDLPTRCGVECERRVAGRVHVGPLGSHPGVHRDPRLRQRQAGGVGQRAVGLHSRRRHDQVGTQDHAVVQHDFTGAECPYTDTAGEFGPGTLDQRDELRARVSAETLLLGQLFRSDEGDRKTLDGKGSRCLAADEPGTDHHRRSRALSRGP